MDLAHSPGFDMAFPNGKKLKQVVLRAVAADRSALLYASPELRRNKVPLKGVSLTL